MWVAPYEFCRLAVDVIDMAPHDAYIVECGSGLTTVLLAEAMGPEQQLVALEHQQNWLERAEHAVRDCDQVEVCFVGMADGFYAWEPEREIDVVILDGPREGKDRAKMLSRWGRWLADDAIVVIDDYARDEECYKGWLSSSVSMAVAHTSDRGRGIAEWHRVK